MSTQAYAIYQHPELASKLRCDDRDDQKQPDGHILVFARDTGQAQRALERCQGEDGENDPRNGALAAIDVYAAENDDHHDRERQAGAVVGSDTVVAQCQDDARERGHQTRDAEQRGPERRDAHS